MEFSIGQIVISKAGRDKGKAFIITELEDEYVYLVDGKLRCLDNPKRKKIKHLQPTHTVNEHIKTAVIGRVYIKDADFRSALDAFCNKNSCTS